MASIGSLDCKHTYFYKPIHSTFNSIQQWQIKFAELLEEEPQLPLHVTGCVVSGFPMARESFKDALNNIKIGGFKLGFLVRPAGIDLCIYYHHICVRLP